MTVLVDISDRLYDYTDEEAAGIAVSAFQEEFGISDQEIVLVWGRDSDPRRTELEKRVFKAIEANGSVKRAAESVPSGITLTIE